MKSTGIIASLVIIVAMFSMGKATASTAVVAVLDRSGSTETTDPRGIQAIATQIMITDIELVDPTATCGLIYFSSSAVKENDLRPCANVRSTLSRVDLMDEPEGNTHMKSGLEMALDMLRNSSSQRKIILLITDGNPDEENRNTEDLKNEILELVTNSFRPHGVEIYALGLGLNDETFLNNLAKSSNGGRSIVARNASELISSAKRLFQQDNIFPVNFSQQKKSSNLSQKFEFDLPDGIQSAKVVTLFESSMTGYSGIAADDITANLTGPSGSMELLDPMYSKKIRDTYGNLAALYGFIESPVPGKYSVTVSPAPNGELVGTPLGKINLLVDYKADFDLDFEIRPKKDKYIAGEKIAIIPQLNTSAAKKNVPGNFTGKMLPSSKSSVGLNFAGGQAIAEIPHGTRSLTIEIQGRVNGISKPLVKRNTITVVEPDKVILATNVLPNGIVFDKIDPEAGSTISKSFIVSYSQSDHERRNLKPVNVSFQWDPRPLKEELGSVSIPIEKLFTMNTTNRNRKVLINGQQLVRIKSSSDKTSNSIELRVKLKIPKITSTDTLQHLKGKYSGAIKISGDNIQAPLRIPVSITMNAPTLKFDGIEAGDNYGDNSPNTNFYWNGSAGRNIILPAIYLDSNGTGLFEVFSPEFISDESGHRLARIESVNGRAGELSETGEMKFGKFSLGTSPQIIKIFALPIEENLLDLSVSETGFLNYRIESNYGSIQSRELIKVWREPSSPNYLGRLVEMLDPDKRSLQIQNIIILTIFSIFLYWLIRYFFRSAWLWIRFHNKTASKSIKISNGESLSTPTPDGRRSLLIGTFSYDDGDRKWHVKTTSKNLFLSNSKKENRILPGAEFELKRGSIFGVLSAKNLILWRFTVSKVLNGKITLRIKKSPISGPSVLIKKLFWKIVALIVSIGLITYLGPYIYLFDLSMVASYL